MPYVTVHILELLLACALLFIGACAWPTFWMSPAVLRRAAAKMLARANAIEAYLTEARDTELLYKSEIALRENKL